VALRAAPPKLPGRPGRDPLQVDVPVAVGVELGGDVGVGNRERGAGSARPGAGGVGARPAGGAAGPLGPVHHRLSCSDDIPDLASRTTSSRSAFGQRRSPTAAAHLPGRLALFRYLTVKRAWHPGAHHRAFRPPAGAVGGASPTCLAAPV